MPNDYYANYDEFVSRANTIQVGTEWFRLNIQKLGSPQKILSVGCGAGAIDIEVIKLLSPKIYVAVEPDEVLLNKFKEKIESSSEFNKTTFKFINKTFEDYQPEDGIRFDLVMMIQSLYYIADKETAIEKVFKLGKEMVFLLMSEKAGMHQMQKDLLPKQELTYITVNSEDISKMVKNMGLKSTYLGTIHATLKVDNPPKGLLEFLLERKLGEKDKLVQTATEYLSDKFKDGVLHQYSDIYNVCKN